ncbi:MAG: VTT domain-containing protein [Nitrospirota bacterium]
MIVIDKKTLLKFLIFILAFGGLLYVMYAFGWLDLFTNKDRLLRFIQEHRTYAVSLFIGLQALQVVFAPVPGEVSGFVGGILFGTFWGIVFSTIGLTLGSWIAFSLARVVGRPLVESIVNPETVQRYDYLMKHKGLFLAFLLFLLPGFPKDYLCYLLGLGHMSVGAFLFVSVFGRLLGTTMLTLGGSFFRNQQFMALFTLAGICILIIMVTIIYRKNIEQWFRALRARHLIKTRADRERLKKMQNGS